jgi:CDP-glycerol glycerophosphotransferase
VSSFTFERGNLAKLMGAPRYVAGEIRAGRSRRDPRQWVFGSAFGVSDGALALLRELRQADPQTRVTWIAGSEAEADQARAEGVTAVLKNDPRAEHATLRAGVVVITHGFGDVARYACAGAVIVQLWHGTPLKRLHLDSPAALGLPGVGSAELTRRAVARLYARGTGRISVVPVSSPAAQARLCSALALPPERVPVLGEPRADVLFRGSQTERRAAALETLEARVGPLNGRRLVLHAATWRDGRGDPTIPSRTEWQDIEAWCSRTGSVFVVRPHPLARGRYDHVTDAVRVLDPAGHPDLNSILSAIDILITDYSSVLVDFATTGRPTVFLADDVEQYSTSRGLYVEVDELTNGRVQRTWAEALTRLDQLVVDGVELATARGHAERIAARYHLHRDGRNTERVLAHVADLVRRRFEVPGDRRDPLVLFESYYGRFAACNPRAIDAEIARRRPEVERVWAVCDGSVEVPAGARSVVVGSDSWREARERARLLVINDWIRDSWRPRRDQFVLQTWHGTPLKRLALSRSGRTPRQVGAVVKQSSRWDALLAQSPWARRRLRRAYAVARPVWVTGYPRNDALVAPGRGPAAAALQIEAGTKVLLYAPTWRDDAIGAADPLDSADLARRLGPAWRVLVRGHSRTVDARSPVDGEGVVDVTGYPDITDLMRLADVLMTDYSSVMFDFVVTGRPMVFFVPDIGDYGRRVRGFYFDIQDRPPGPVVSTIEGAVEAVRTAGEPATVRRWSTDYEAWRARFAPFDDGAASARVVDRLIDRGVI